MTLDTVQPKRRMLHRSNADIRAVNLTAFSRRNPFVQSARHETVGGSRPLPPCQQAMANTRCGSLGNDSIGSELTRNSISHVTASTKSPSTSPAAEKIKSRASGSRSTLETTRTSILDTLVLPNEIIRTPAGMLNNKARWNDLYRKPSSALIDFYQDSPAPPSDL